MGGSERPGIHLPRPLRKKTKISTWYCTSVLKANRHSTLYRLTDSNDENGTCKENRKQRKKFQKQTKHITRLETALCNTHKHITYVQTTHQHKKQLLTMPQHVPEAGTCQARHARPTRTTHLIMPWASGQKTYDVRSRASTSSPCTRGRWSIPIPAPPVLPLPPPPNPLRAR